MWSQDLYKKALDFAAQAHGTQKVPGNGFPYVVHLTKVAMETMASCVNDPSADINLAMTCALLHDCMEDAGVTADQLTVTFGPAVAAGVQALTKDDSLPKEAGMADSLARIRRQPREVWMVKLGDRITNLEPPPSGWTLEKRRRYLEEARLILRSLQGASALLETRIAEKIAAYEEYCREDAKPLP
jgi:(p)ppGpp synthase/HD superfamily hydrolase